MQIHSSVRYGDIDGVRRQLAKGVPVDIRGGTEGMTPLMVAASSKRSGVDIMELLVALGADLHARSRFSQKSPLDLAAKGGDLEKTQFLLKAGADPKSRSSSGYTALISAVYGYRNSLQGEIVQALLAAGTDPDVVTEYGESALKVASAFGNFQVVRTLLDSGASAEPLHWTVLMHAIAFGSTDEVSAELQKGADLTATDSVGRTPWQLSLAVGDMLKCQSILKHDPPLEDTDLMFVLRNDDVELLKWLIDLGADVNARKKHIGDTVLMVAAREGATRCVHALLEAGADVSATDDLKSSAIENAANAQIAQALVEAGADINYRNGQGYTLLRTAIEDGKEELVRELLAMGASTEADITGNSPLFHAVVFDELEIAKTFLEAGADPNILNIDDWFPLQEAQSVEMSKALLDGGADIDFKDTSGHNALYHQTDPDVISFLIEVGISDTSELSLYSALQRGSDPKLVQYLLERGADLEATTSWGQTPLMKAAENSFAAGVRLLIEAGASPHAQDNKGRTALFYAAAPEGFPSHQITQSVHKRLMEDDERSPLLAEILEKSPHLGNLFGYAVSDSTEALELLVEAGADLNAKNDKGMTPLMFAASCGRPARVESLLALGADKSLKDKAGRTALDHAQDHPVDEHREAIIRLLS